MAYDGTIPALGNLISNDIPAMQENFSLLESAQIVDSGTTADGDYWRFEEGLQICKSITFNLVANFSTNFPIYFTLADDRQVWSFPQSFIQPPAISGSNRETFNSVITIGSVTNTSAVSGIVADREYPAGSEVPLQLIAIGRWK